MDRLLPTMHSSYPRIGDTYEEQELRRAIHEWEQRRITDKELQRVEDEVVRGVIAEQEQAGLAVVTDGMIRWYCPLSHLARRLESVEIDGLLRYFDTNFYFRQPVVKGSLRWTVPILVREFTFAQSLTQRPVKVVLTGPYTMAKLSIVETDLYRGRLERLVEDYAQAWASEVQQLVAAGARWIQIEEPALLQAPQDAPMVRYGLEIIGARKGSAEMALALYWGDIGRVYDTVQDWPVDMLILDFVYTPTLVDVIARDGSAKALGLGLIDGRNTKMEDSDTVLRQIERMAPRLSGTHHLTTSCGVELLPRDRARAKIALVARIVESFQGGTA